MPDPSRLLVAQGAAASARVKAIDHVRVLADVEFSVFSQSGEDGIIEWLVHKCDDIPDKFVEFGVESYKEANTRFLALNRNWRGLVIDSSTNNVKAIENDKISWQRDVIAKCEFVTAENIDRILVDAGFSGEIGILSIDIDGNDYWIWKAIKQIHPQLVIIEYNAVLGDVFDLTIPYDPHFNRTKAHYSNLYFGASIGALLSLGREKGYTLLGTNSIGSNAFFIRDDRAPLFEGKIASTAAKPSRFREARTESGQLSFVRGRARADLIARCNVVDVSTGRKGPLVSFGDLYSKVWSTAMD